jgi:murein DD-endopeptidase MepM/ murein hydrolase activator NlpD
MTRAWSASGQHDEVNAMAVSTAPGLLQEGMSDPEEDKGPIHTAQWLLSGHNAFRESYHPNGVDGIFGEDTAKACVRAKLALGYPRKACEPTFGRTLRSYLMGDEQLPPPYLKRRQQRTMGAGVYGYPAAMHARIIQSPFQGTHAVGHPFDNWESNQAWDLGFPFGTPLIAAADGTIGSQIGAIHSSNPLVQGLRCHLVTDGNEFFYQHLSRLDVAAGQTVRKGDRIGLSGRANGTDHLHLGVLNLAAYRSVIEG